MLVVQGKDKPRLQASEHLLFRRVTVTWPSGVDRELMEVMLTHWTQATSQVCCFCPLQQQVPLVISVHGSLFAHHILVVFCRMKT